MKENLNQRHPLEEYTNFIITSTLVKSVKKWPTIHFFWIDTVFQIWRLAGVKVFLHLLKRKSQFQSFKAYLPRVGFLCYLHTSAQQFQSFKAYLPRVGFLCYLHTSAQQFKYILARKRTQTPKCCFPQIFQIYYLFPYRDDITMYNNFLKMGHRTLLQNTL